MTTDQCEPLVNALQPSNTNTDTNTNSNANRNKTQPMNAEKPSLGDTNRTKNPPSTTNPPPSPSLSKDPLLPYILPSSKVPPHLSHIRHELMTKGYAIVPSVLNQSECRDAVSKLWDFVEDVSGGVVRRCDPTTWYPPSQLRPVEEEEGKRNNNSDDDDKKDETDPWPSTGYSSFPDMFQSLGAGFLLGETREQTAKRVFEPLFGTHELHCSKEGFTFARPTLVTLPSTTTTEQETATHSPQSPRNYRWERPGGGPSHVVCGEVQPEGYSGEHYDQAHGVEGLHTVQSLLTFVDQSEGCGDGHFLVYPYSHSHVHRDVTTGIYRGRFTHVPLLDEEVGGVLRRIDGMLVDDAAGGGGGGDPAPAAETKDRQTTSKKITPHHIYTRAGDMILWRSDILHAAVPPSNSTPNFRAVGYIAMAPACLTPPTSTLTTRITTATVATAKRKKRNKTTRRMKTVTVDTLERKMEAYRWGKTGDHRAGVESWHDHRRRGVRGGGEVDWVLERQRPYFRMSPPLLTPRLAQLYGLLPYGIQSEEQRAEEINKAIIRGVRFLPDHQPHPSPHPHPHPPHNNTSDHPPCHARTKHLMLNSSTPLIGQDKYLGGMCSSCGKYVFGVPGHAKRVLRVDTETDAVDLIGPEYGGEFKWLRGLDVPSEVMRMDGVEGEGGLYPRGCCLALPCNERSVLKIDPETGDVTTFGHIEEEGWLYHGGNLAADGFVYAVPANATRVLKIDPRQETLSYIGPSYPGHQKWFGGILASDGCIYGIPHNATGILKINPQTQSVTVVDDGLFPPGGWKWHGGLAVRNDTMIIGFPNNADSVMVFDVVEQRTFTVGDRSVLASGRHRIPQDGRYMYLGGAVSLDGRFTYLFPCDAERVCRIDNDTFDLRLVGPELLEGANKYQNGFVSTDGCLYGIPQRASGVLRITPGDVVARLSAAKGGVGDALSCDAKGGEGQVEEEDRVDVLYCGDDMIQYRDKFEGGVIDFNGNIYCIPLRAKMLLKVIPDPSISI